MSSPIDIPRPPDLSDDLRAAVRALGPGALWVADVVPLLRRGAPTATETEQADARYAFVLVMAESIRLYADLLSDPVADRAAQYIADGVRAAVEAAGVVPGTLAVRGQTVASAVHRLLTEGDPRFDEIVVTPVDAIADIPGTPGDAFAATTLELRRAMDGDTIPDAPTAVALRWSQWGVPLADVAAFFRAAAALYRASNTRGFTGDGEGTMFVLDTPGGGETVITVAGTPPPPPYRPDYVTVYTELEDWGAMVDSASTDPRTAAVRHPIMNLRYIPASELELSAVHEIREHGWETASSTAYPWVWLLNPVGGGLTTAYLHTLTAQLGALARALASDGGRGALDVDLSLHSIDRETGIGVHTIAV